MSVQIDSVTGIAAQVGISAGDMLVSINNNPINDVLDYDFYVCYNRLELELLHQNGEPYHLSIEKGEYDPLGLAFQTYLIDKQHSCTNKCIFCFVDQMPPSMRESLYFKDDDSRLSFLFGNYITLTNMKSEEIDRIIKMRISPINISVHTVNPELRCSMMNNRFAGEVLSYLKRLADGGIKLNCQLVLCPGYNDGEELSRSLNELGQLFPAVQSIACVPVGLTKHRDGLAQLEPFNRDTAAAVIDRIEAFSSAFLSQHGTRLCYPADEFFIKACRLFPAADYYEDFCQIENGVGMTAALTDEFESALSQLDYSQDARHVTLATGVDAKPQIERLTVMLAAKRPNVRCDVVAIENRFFGETITVAGLITGGDLITQLADVVLGEELLIPACMLQHEHNRFLDDVTLSQLETAVERRVCTVPNDGFELLDAILGE